MTAFPKHPDETPRRSRIPQFATYEEEAEFWDTHDVTEFWDELQPASEPLGEFAGHLVGIPITSAQMSVLSERARAEGTNEVELARRWVAERLSSVEAEREGSSPPAREESR